MAFEDVMEQAATRVGCNRKIVLNEMRAYFRTWSKSDPRF